MRKLNCFLLLSVVLLLLVGCSKTDTQTETLKSDEVVTVEKAKPNQFVPFYASFEVSVDLLSVLTGPNVPYPPPFPHPDDLPFLKYQLVNCEGNASHLGNTDVEIEQWWRPRTLPPIPEFYGDGVGNFIFTAANGDELLANYSDAVSFHETATYVEITLTGDFKDGGTGRFTNAEGEFLWEGVFNPVDNFGTVTVTGVIKYSK